MTKRLVLFLALAAGCGLAATAKPKPADPTPGEPLTVTMGQRTPVKIRVARGQATLIRLPDGQRVMNVYGADKGDGGVWAVDAGKVPTRFLAVKPKEIGIHTTLHVVSNSGREISFYLQEVTGVDSQFDAEVEAADDNADPVAKEVKWVPADEVTTCKQSADSLKIDVAEVERKAQEAAAAEVLAYQKSYPKKLFFGYAWDHKKAEKLGFESAWSDDKFTYFKAKNVLALYEINEDGKPSLIQYRYADGLYRVDKVLYDGYFAIGPKKGNKLIFHRDRGKS
jgi:type IV secretion system protein VirB9